MQMAGNLHQQKRLMRPSIRLPVPLISPYFPSLSPSECVRPIANPRLSHTSAASTAPPISLCAAKLHPSRPKPYHPRASDTTGIGRRKRQHTNKTRDRQRKVNSTEKSVSIACEAGI
ncbi:hypothetical protein N656DRAFT_527414 [Canariomyces notabilis]|uniref:Uncharacterized protein n=1 Tax=Canariomyces notabilis TaxID=2074819 RepID=A0AAN6THC4_9PEZI|nr:hypothetical protein N656DRAFT_527414 [Canariomyces arenarius]